MRGCWHARKAQPTTAQLERRSTSRARCLMPAIISRSNGSSRTRNEPSHMHVYGASDFAVTQDGGDWTVHIVVGIDPEDRMYVLDVWRKRASAEVWVESYCDLVLQWKPIEWAFEGGQIKSAVGPFLERRARERRAYCGPKIFPSRHDKSVRAQAIRGKMALDSLYVPIYAHWFPDFFC